MLPAVETAYRPPAVVPTVATARACSRTAKGEIVPRNTLGTRNRTAQARSGLSRVPRSLVAMTRFKAG